MKISVFSAKAYEIPYFLAANQNQHKLEFIEEASDIHSVEKIKEADVACCFVTDQLDKKVLTRLKEKGIKLIALRSAGFDHVDLETARELNLTVVRVPSYSPNAIAEFTVGMMLALTRKIILAHDQIKQNNFSLQGQLGFNIENKTVGIIGTGQTGTIVAKILTGFNCQLLACDPTPNSVCETIGVTYTSREHLLKAADIITLHCPMSAETHYMINKNTLDIMKPGAILINTARGTLIDTQAMIHALEDKKIGALGIDVYEHERGLFFEDHSNDVIADEIFTRLQSFSNVLITGHQAYFTKEALENITKITLENIAGFEKGNLQNQV